MTDKKRDLIYVALLILLTITLRLVPIFPTYFPFMYDHAKDALVIMQMGTTGKPALIGPVTSIPGVYYGPLWYYLALPLNMLMNYHPLASVLTVILLGAVSVFFLYRTVGWLPAWWYAVSLGLINTQNSAWTPYLTPLVTLPILLILLRLKRKQKISTAPLVGLALLSSLCFHFQPAFGVVLVPIVIVALFLLKIKMSWKQILVAVALFLVPFTPQAFFEIRHDFHQTKEILNFISHYREEANRVQPNQKGLGRVTEIGSDMLNTAGQALSPIEVPFQWVGIVGAVIATAAIVASLKNHKKKSTHLSREEVIVFATFLIGTFVLYLFLPAKSYYFVALLPVWVVLIGKLVTVYLPKRVAFISVLLVLMSLTQMILSRQHNVLLAKNSDYLLQSKMDAIQKVYALSNGQPFVSYHFVPELYDYTYQFLYRYYARQGYPTPTEYAYAPGETAYMEQVAPALTTQPPAQKPSLTFLIFQKPVYDWAYADWVARVATHYAYTNDYSANTVIGILQEKPKE